MRTYETPNGKEISCYYDGRNLRLKFTQGGELPLELSGIFTNETAVEKAVNIYLAGKHKDGNKQTRQPTE